MIFLNFLNLEMDTSWPCEDTEILTQRSTEEENSDLTNPTSNHTLDTDIAVFVVNDTF